MCRQWRLYVVEGGRGRKGMSGRHIFVSVKLDISKRASPKTTNYKCHVKSFEESGEIKDV